GASRGRLARLLLTEALMLASAGGAAGLLLAQWALQAMASGVPADRPASMPFLEHLRLGGPVLALPALCCLAAAACCGLAPAFSAWRTSPLRAIRSGGVVALAGRRREAAAWLVAAEIALTMVLLTAAGLLVRSTLRLLDTDTGYRADRVLAIDLQVPAARRLDPAAAAEFSRSLTAAVSAIPGVAGAATVRKPPTRGVG